MVVHFVPAHRVVALLESLTGTAPSVGFVHGMLARTAGLLAEVHERIRALITLAYAVCCDETPLRVGATTPAAGEEEGRAVPAGGLHRALHPLPARRPVPGHVQGVRLADLAATGSVIVHDRYQNYDSAAFGALVHQLCTAHLLRDLDDAAQVYPDAVWPTQIADALRELIHQANLARDPGRDAIAARSATAAAPVAPRRAGRAVRHHQPRHPPRRTQGPAAAGGPARPRADVLRFAHDLGVPPTSNQAERDLRPSKIQQKISGRLTSEERTQDRYTILGYVSTAAKHGLDKITVLRDALPGRPWMPALPAPA